MKAMKKTLCLLLALCSLAAAALADDGNTAPVAENMELNTCRGVSVGGQLEAHDGDGDCLSFELMTEPMKGTVELDPDGHFVYTPEEKRRGRDYFGFCAVDEAGNVSQEGTVIIRMTGKACVTYADMTGDGAEYAAVAMTDAGVFCGKTVGNDCLFCPDESVSRGEFLSMCMTALDSDVLKGVSSTGFADDGEIPDWVRPYVATALMKGYIRGRETESGTVFDAEGAITLGEACMLLNSALGITDVVSAAVTEDAGSADGRTQAAANLTACGITPERETDADEDLTRADAAVLLEKAMELLDRR